MALCKTRKQRNRRTAYKRNPGRIRRQIYGIEQSVTVNYSDTDQITLGGSSKYGWIFGYSYDVTYKGIWDSLTKYYPSEWKLLSANIEIVTFLRPESHFNVIGQTTTYSPSASAGAAIFATDKNAYSSDFKLADNLSATTKGSMTSESYTDLFCMGLTLQDGASTDQTMKFKTIQDVRCHTGTVSRLVAEPGIITLRKTWRPTEPSEREWSGRIDKGILFRATLAGSNCDSRGWVTPDSSPNASSRIAEVLLKIVLRLRIRGSNTLNVQ